MMLQAGRARLLGCIALVALACLVGATSARADVPGPITTRVMNILNTAGNGTLGMYVKEVGGPEIAAQNEDFAFGPASSIKVLLHLYMHDQVEANAAAFTDQVTLYAGVNTSCPNGAMVLGTEDLDDSAAKMMRVSDNPATRAQYEHWVPAPGTINAYATALGLTQTQFTNFVGCDFGQPALDGNTTSLTDLGIIYESVSDSSQIAGAIRTNFYNTMSGREQAGMPGGDFTGIWPILVTMSAAEAPAGMPASLLQDFRAGMTANHKGGSYQTCSTMGCSRTQWLSWAGSAVFPTCESNAFSSRSYVWGAFLHGTNDPNYNGTASPADTAFLAVRAEPLREQMNAALAGWGACYPPDVTVTTTPSAPPAGPGRLLQRRRSRRERRRDHRQRLGDRRLGRHRTSSAPTTGTRSQSSTRAARTRERARSSSRPTGRTTSNARRPTA